MSNKAKQNALSELVSWKVQGNQIQQAACAAFKSVGLDSIAASNNETLYAPILRTAFHAAGEITTDSEPEKARSKAFNESVKSTLESISEAATGMLSAYRAHGGEGLNKIGDEITGSVVILKLKEGKASQKGGKKPELVKVLRSNALCVTLSHSRTVVAAMPSKVCAKFAPNATSYTVKALSERIKANGGIFDADMLTSSYALRVNWTAPESEDEQSEDSSEQASNEVVSAAGTELPAIDLDATRPINDEQAEQYLEAFSRAFMAMSEYERGALRDIITASVEAIEARRETAKTGTDG